MSSASALPPLPLMSHRSAKLQGTVRTPGDKSISHRALMLASQVVGRTTISGLLEGEDVICTLRALQALGVPIRSAADGRWVVDGVGTGGFSAPVQALDMGNAGTATRLLMGMVASHPFTSFFVGDASLSSRPMARVITPLKQMGADFVTSEGNRLPLAVIGTPDPLPIDYTLPVASAQVKSAVLLAALNTPGVTTVIEPVASRDHTENMLRDFGFELETADTPEGRVIRLRGEQEVAVKDKELHVPADPSSAAFLVVAALITPGSKVEIPNICINPLRIGLFTTLEEMGAKIAYHNRRIVGGEPVADLRVESSALTGVEVPADRAPSMIDEYPILAVAAACAAGTTVMRGLEELRVKESDRFNAIVGGLMACGVAVKAEGDSIAVTGDPGNIRGGAVIPTRLDHRIAMSFLVMGLVTNEAVTVDDTRCIQTSFPGFTGLLQHLGAKLSAPGSQPREAQPKPVPSRPHRRMVIAIDGPAASGKGSLARRLADHYGLGYLDTGKLYRAVGLKLVYHGQSPDNEEEAVKAAYSITPEDLSNPKLLQEHIGKAASVVSAMPGVRQALLEFQRNYATREQGAVLDGRDIGTVICPDADVKFFVTADILTRAHRRHKELQGYGVEVVFDSVLGDLQERDRRDSQRNTAPLKAAADAIALDTTHMDADTVFRTVLELVDGKLEGQPVAVKA